MTTVAKEARPNKAEGRELGTPAAATLVPMPCIACGNRVKWIRYLGKWSLRDEDGVKHRCAA